MKIKQQRYRQAVKSIHWSAEKRAEIEAKLLSAVPQNAAASDHWDDDTDDPMATFIQSRESIRKMEETEMAVRKMRKIMWIGIAAALLAMGGTIAGIAAYAKKHPQTINITWKNGTMLHLTSEEHSSPYNKDYYPNPTGSVDYITPTENGWYFRKTVFPADNDNSILLGGISTLYYCDRATGTTVPVCAKPNCLHDGNEYCSATTKTYACSYMQYYNGNLYTVTTKYLHPENRYSLMYPDCENSDDCRQVLLRYSPDGTEITELADFGCGIGATACAINRGYVWCVVQIQEKGEDIENPITHNTQSFVSGGWQLWGYELATGKSVLVYDASGDPTVNHVNATPDELYAYGDYIYFERVGNDWSGGQGLSRLSLLTGEVTEDDAEVIISGSHFACMSSTHAISYKEVKAAEGGYTVEYSLIDLDTLEQKVLTSDPDQEPDNRALLGRDEPIIFMNDQYIFTSSTENYMEGERRTFYIGIYDYDGNLVKHVNTGYQYESWRKPQKDKDGNYQSMHYSQFLTPIALDGDTIYAKYSIIGDEETLKERGEEAVFDILYTTVDELLSGDPKWQKAYSMKEEVLGNAE